MQNDTTAKENSKNKQSFENQQWSSMPMINRCTFGALCRVAMLYERTERSTAYSVCLHCLGLDA